MSFYTNVQNVKGQIFYRGIDDKGRHFKQKVDYNPSLFIPSAKESKWKTLEGENVSEVPCGSINEARDFIRKYEGVDNFKIYGNTNFHYCFIADIDSILFCFYHHTLLRSTITMQLNEEYESSELLLSLIHI